MKLLNIVITETIKIVISETMIKTIKSLIKEWHYYIMDLSLFISETVFKIHEWSIITELWELSMKSKYSHH